MLALLLRYPTSYGEQIMRNIKCKLVIVAPPHILPLEKMRCVAERHGNDDDMLTSGMIAERTA